MPCEQSISTAGEAADTPRGRAPLTTVLILVTVAATLSGRSVAMSGGHDAAPRLDRRQFVQLLAEEVEQDIEPTPEPAATGAVPADAWTTALSRDGLPFACPSRLEATQADCLLARVDWQRRLINLPPPACV